MLGFDDLRALVFEVQDFGGLGVWLRRSPT